MALNEKGYPYACYGYTAYGYGYATAQPGQTGITLGLEGLAPNLSNRMKYVT